MLAKVPLIYIGIQSLGRRLGRLRHWLHHTSRADITIVSRTPIGLALVSDPASDQYPRDNHLWRTQCRSLPLTLRLRVSDAALILLRLPMPPIRELAYTSGSSTPISLFCPVKLAYCMRMNIFSPLTEQNLVLLLKGRDFFTWKTPRNSWNNLFSPKISKFRHFEPK